MVFFTLPTDLGLGIYGAREIARRPARAATLLHEITGLRVVLSASCMVLLAIFILVVRQPVTVKLLLGAYGLSLVGVPYLLIWFFQAHDAMHWVGAASVVRQAVLAALVFTFCHGRADLVRMGFFECGSVGASAAFCIYATRKMGYGWAWPSLRFRTLIPHLREASPIGLVELAWAFMWYFCTVLLGFMHEGPDVGWFGASHRALMALHTFVWLYFFNLMPSISRCVDLPAAQLLKLSDASMRFAAWVGLLVAGLLTALAPELLGLVYGRSFRPAWPSFAILMWLLPVALIGGHHRYILVAYNQQKRLLRCTVIAAAASVALGFILIPAYGGPGAACALLTANLIHLALVYLSVKSLVVKVPVAGQIARPVAALALAAPVFWWASKWNVWAAAAAGSAVYLGVLAVADGASVISFAHGILRRPALR